MDKIKEFSTDRGVVLDEFQIKSAQALMDGCSVLVAAPTGSGKTLVADFACYLAQSNKTRVIYTTPIKALSNQKFIEFSEIYGEENVGLATGDRSIRPNAKITIMTTEVLRNIIYTAQESLDNVSHVILDEVHYISDRSRGAVWEEVIIQLPLEIDLVCLSATVSNAEEVAQWLTTVRGSTQAIIHETRAVPLTYWFSFRKKKQGLQVMPLLAHKESSEADVHPDLYRALRERYSSKTRDKPLAPRRLDLIDYLNSNSMLPAIFFIFSRAGCDDALHECFNTHIQLTNHEERKQIRSICDRHLDALSNDEFDALDYDIITYAMERGFAPHHAGLIPPLREAVEEAFALGLIKVVFATETLAVGVNMPAKTVVIEKLTKFNGDHHDIVTPGEFTQLTGRAGRRGIDVVGHAIVEWNRFVDFEQAASLASTRSYALRSSFRPTYNMATNLINSYSPSHARHILNLSLAQYQSDDAVVSLEQNLETKRKRMEEIRAQFSQTDKQFATMVHKRKTELDSSSKYGSAHDPSYDFIRSLHTGDVLDGFKHIQACAVITKSRPTSMPQVNVIDLHGRTHTISPEQVDKGVQVVGKIDLPQPIAKRNKNFRVSVSIELKKLLTKTGRVRKDTKQKTKPKGKQKNAELLDEYISAMKETTKLTRRVQSRGQSLARQFERILAILNEYGYVDNWELTEKGIALSKINAEADLVITEHLINNLFDDFTVPELAAFLSAFIFESRFDSDLRSTRFPTESLEKAFKKSEKYITKLNTNERDAGIKESRGLDFAMVYPSYLWAKGKPLNEILESRDIAGGDFVRAMKSILDLLRQIEDASPGQKTKDLASATIDACFRDIIEISS